MNGGGIGKQVMGELGNVAKQAVEELGSVVSAPAPQKVQGAVEEQEIRDRSQRRATSALERVRQELADYVAKKKQKDNQEEAIEERQEEVEKQEEKQKVESERDAQIAQAQRSGGGTGEIISKKN